MGTPERIARAGLRVAVLCGGAGSERAVSLVSGRSVADALDGLGVPFDLFELPANALPGGLCPDRHIVLPIVHGTYGEDGRLSAELEQGGFAYAGCDQASSAICFDKLACKSLAAYIGIPVARDVPIRRGAAPAYASLVARLGEPLILKPRRDGSSVGLHLVRDAAQYAAAAADIEGGDYLAEAYISGHDLTVGILGGEALGVIGVHPAGGLYDYQHKYTSGMSRYEVPAAIPGQMEEQLAGWTRAIFEACGCRDLARVDFRLGADGGLYFLEVNTLPGMTPTSLLPKAAQCRGISFAELVLKWVEFALGRKGGER